MKRRPLYVIAFQAGFFLLVLGFGAYVAVHVFGMIGSEHASAAPKSWCMSEDQMYRGSPTFFASIPQQMREAGCDAYGDLTPPPAPPGSP